MAIITFNQLGKYGRLGNQMFQIASTIGIARKNGYSFAFPYWKNYDHIDRFGSTEDVDVQNNFINKLPIYNGPTLNDHFIDWGYWPINLRGGNISISGHLQSEKYFLHCQDEVFHYFKMKNEYPETDSVAIHVRLGDYDDNYHPRLKIDYYSKAIDKFPKGTKFLIFSDDKNEAEKMFSRHYIIDKDFCFEVFEGKDYFDDLAKMRSCRHFIIGNSTYSWWAAWLGRFTNKKIIAPSNWFGAIAGLSSKDIYCKNWEVI